MTKGREFSSAPSAIDISYFIQNSKKINRFGKKNYL